MRETIVRDQLLTDKAQTLARRLGAAKAFRDCERALEKYQSDPSAASILAEFRELQQELSTTAMLWGEPNSQRAEELRMLQRRVETHPTILAVQQAESELLTLLVGCVLRLGELTGIDYVEACTGRSLSGCGPGLAPAEIKSALANVPEVQSALEELAQSIKQTISYQMFEEARRTFLNDPEVNRIREEMNNAQRRYLQAQSEGQVTLNLIQEVRSTQSQLREHAAVKHFAETRRQVLPLFQSVNRAISEALGIDVAQMLAPARGCCG